MKTQSVLLSLSYPHQVDSVRSPAGNKLSTFDTFGRDASEQLYHIRPPIASDILFISIPVLERVLGYKGLLIRHLWFV